MKERLTGAIILVALMVLLIPELLTGPVRSASPPQTPATSPEEPPLRSYTINLADDSHARSTSGTSSSATPDPSGPAQPAPGSLESPAAITEGSDAAEATTSGADSAASAPSAPSAPSAAKDGKDAKDAALPSAPPKGTQPAAAPAPRMPAGPENAPVPLSRHHPEPVSAGDGMTSHAAAGSWMVQLGVFASRSNADRLAQELKGKGFKVSVSETPGTGRKLFRVRAGPVSDRTAAADLASRLRAVGASGSVVPRS